jgi:hypothetical protein
LKSLRVIIINKNKLSMNMCVSVEKYLKTKFSNCVKKKEKNNGRPSHRLYVFTPGIYLMLDELKGLLKIQKKC